LPQELMSSRLVKKMLLGEPSRSKIFVAKRLVYPHAF